MVANIESPLFKVARDVEENIEEYNISDPTIPLNNIVSQCFVVSEKPYLKGIKTTFNKNSSISVFLGFAHFGIRTPSNLDISPPTLTTSIFDQILIE